MAWSRISFTRRYVSPLVVFAMTLVGGQALAPIASASSAVGDWGYPAVWCNWESPVNVDEVFGQMYPSSSPQQLVAWRAWMRQVATGRWYYGRWKVTSATPETVLDSTGFLAQNDPSFALYGGSGTFGNLPGGYDYELYAQYGWNDGGGWTFRYQAGYPYRPVSSYTQFPGSTSWYICSLIPAEITMVVTQPLPSSAAVFADRIASLDATPIDARGVNATAPDAAPATAKCLGLAATQVGTSGDDTIVGTPGQDVIAGLAGNDTIYGLRGGDLICGGDGDDRVAGGVGGDTIIGSSGTDTLLGGSGTDDLSGGAGFDAIEPGLGNDHADAGRDSGVISYLLASHGQAVNLGDGSSSGGDGQDKFSGFDSVFGSQYRDTITGSKGNDHIAPFGGNDVIDGRGGFDALYFLQWILKGAPQEPEAVDLVVGQANGPEGTPDSLAHVESVYGTPYADTLVGDAGVNFLAGDAGDDVLRGGPAADTLYGGDGEDNCLSAVTYTSCENKGGDVFPEPPRGNKPRERKG